MPYLPVNGGSLYYETEGDGNPSAIVFVHAGICNLRMWDAQAAAFSDRYQVVRYDTRGFGKTTTEDVEYSNRADMIALLDHLNISKAILVGCSRGGQIAMDTTLEFPNRVAALCLIGSGPGGYIPEGYVQPPEEVAIEEAMQAADEAKDWDRVTELDIELWVVGPRRDAGEVNPEVLDRAYAMARGNYEHDGEGGKPIVLNPPAAGRLHELDLPVLVMIGLEDESYALNAADYMAKNIRGAVKVEFENAAHLPNLEFPDKFNKTLAEWLVKA
jgi:pimeloyl-ACP methyl ester carboxylesterase